MSTCKATPPDVATKLGVGPCVLDAGHHGPIHEDAEGRGWQDDALPDPEVEAATPPPLI